MDRKWKSGAAGAPPALDNASDGYATAGNPGGGVPATKPGPHWYHMVTEELLAFITASGIAFDKAVVTQLRDALRRMRDTASRVVGCDSKNNAGTPNTQFDLGARQIVLRDPTTGDTITVRNPAVKTVNLATAGPAANGRDQAGAFGANSWIHFYWIGKKDGTFDGIASAADDATGPVLPSGYTHWAYGCTVRLDGASALKKVRVKGATVHLEAVQSALAAGAATVETAVSVSAVVPPNALSYDIDFYNWSMTTDASGNLSASFGIRVISGSVFAIPIQPSLGGLSASSTVRTQSGSKITLPNVGQQFYYIWAITQGSAQQADGVATAYRIPNGGE